MSVVMLAINYINSTLIDDVGRQNNVKMTTGNDRSCVAALTQSDQIGLA